MGQEWKLTEPLAALTPCEQAGLAYELMEPYRFRPMSHVFYVFTVED